MAIITWFKDALQQVIDFLGNAFQGLFNLLSDLFSGLFSGLIGFLKAVFDPILTFIDGMAYLVKNLGMVVYWVLKNILAMFGLLIALVEGFMNTVSSLFSYDAPQAIDLGVYSNGFNLVMEKVNAAGFQVVAAIIMSLVWIMMVAVLFKVISNNR